MVDEEQIPADVIGFVRQLVIDRREQLRCYRQLQVASRAGIDAEAAKLESKREILAQQINSTRARLLEAIDAWAG